MRWTLIAVLLTALGLAGCGDYDIPEPRGRSAAPEAVGVVVDPMNPAPPVAAKPSAAAAKQTPDAQPSKGPSAPGVQSLPPPPKGMVRAKAEVGAGKKGRYRPGIITTPLSTYWKVQEKLAYEAQVPHALDLYKAEHGQFPKTQKEFEEKILKPNNIKLPELPEGHRYVYDPEEGELLVERPAP